MSSSDIYEQRVVYTGLMRMTTDRNLIKSAYEHWSTKLSNNQFDVVEVVEGLTEYLGLSSVERKTLMVAMHAASSRLVDQLALVPEYITSSTSAVSPIVADQSVHSVVGKSVSAHKAVTERYLQLVCQYVQHSNRESFRELIEIIADEGLPKLSKLLNIRVKQWGNDGLHKINFANDVSSADCESTALEFYVLLSEVIGPVDSDVIVNKAITEALTMAEAQYFNPRDLL